MTYKVNILRSAQKRLAKIDDPTRRRIIDGIRDQELLVLVVDVGHPLGGTLLTFMT